MGLLASVPQHAGLREVGLLPRWVRVPVNKVEADVFLSQLWQFLHRTLWVKAVTSTSRFKKRGHNSTFEECQRIWGQVLKSSPTVNVS